MEKTKTLITELVTVPGLSGYENQIHEYLMERWKPLTDEISTSKIGSLHALKKGHGEGPRPSILIATHMDTIGMMVSGIEDGLLHVTKIGGIDNRTLPGLTVDVHTADGILPSVIMMPPAHTLPESQQSGTVELEYLWVDTGLLPKEVEKKVSIGDLVTFALPPQDLGDGYFSAPGLDNRASVAILTEVLELLQTRLHKWDVWAVATVQEEVGLKGAGPSGFAIRPDLGLVMDVTFGSGPGAPAHETIEMDKGPSYDLGPSTHPKLYQAFIDHAKSQEIPFNRYGYPRSSGTDADKLQLAAEGIPTMVVSLPLRYMHTPVEVIQLRDIQRIARLVATFIEKLDDDFMSTLNWDDESEAAA
ncbi:M20/M25/M40 family metallo-hydrolase [bacterium]|nr:M20/M25/M40 family metallo-hydrolase [bacterium]